MSSLSTTMTAAVERGMRLASVEFARDVIGKLSSEGVLNCSLSDALKLFDFDAVSIVSSRSKASRKREKAKGRDNKCRKVEVTGKPSVLLPFCGVVVEDWCRGVRLNHGLHTQCSNVCLNGDRYCKTCRRHADNSATGKPPYGDIDDRAKYGVNYRDPRGKLSIPYANVVAKMGINLSAAHEAAAKMGWEIPEEQLVCRVTKRGRPAKSVAKSAAVSDTDSEDGEPQIAKNKKRGRPKKIKEKELTQEDQIAQLVAEAYAETTNANVSVNDDAEDNEEGDKLAKKEAAEKTKAEKKAAKEAVKLAKKEAAEKAKAEKKAAKEAAKLVKKKAAEKAKAEKKAAKEAEKLAKKEAAKKAKAEKLAAKKAEQEKKRLEKAAEKAKKLAKAKAAAKSKKSSAVEEDKEISSTETKNNHHETKAANSQDMECDLFLGTDDVDDELHEDVIDDSDDEEGVELSETMEVDGVEYFYTVQDGQTILFTKTGEPVGLYDDESGTIQECEFDEE